MGFPFNLTEWKDILSLVYKRAALDHQFHILCIRDPHAAIKLVCGKNIPKSVKIRFEPQQPDEIVLILPLENKVLFRELTDQDLEAVAMGMATVCVPYAQSLKITHHS